MKPQQVTEALEAVAAQLGVVVSYEAMSGDASGAGGLCKLRGEWRVIVDRKSTASDRASILAEALAGFDTEGIYLPPQVREAIQAHRATRAAVQDGAEPVSPPAVDDQEP